ncbi:hypothetical protein HYFRA_00012751 [Hymenoscyphus fraxineus]|uniref:TBP-associated factor 6 n=1 Tax=Hymenoscyphus fraxineus TaxID=746836 RepID=A0A9N9PZZ3_9HELO|nr:hypothetical protein HYFRA_00012751 [Hymenoscyphus fraxineus]
MAATEQKLVWNPDNIRDIAESVGIAQLNEDAVRSLSAEVEYRVGQVITEAMRVMHQGKRTVLGTQDISQALKVLDVEPLYGYESTRPLRFGEASLGPGQPLFYIEDEEVDFEKLINAPLPKVPRDMSITAHWLAIEGVQPSIPQNPTTAEARASELVPKGPGANPALAALAGIDNVAFKPLVKHVVSKELILFFDKIRQAILDEDPDPDVATLRAAALESVRSDPGLHQLVPYFVEFVAEKITHCSNNLFILRRMMELISAIIDNKTLFIAPYVISLCPTILTCLTARHLGPEGQNLETLKDQFQLRDLAASLIGKISHKYAETSVQLRPRLTRTCLKYFLDPKHTLGGHYGAISALRTIGGPEVIRAILLPNIKPFSEHVIAKAIQERGAGDESVNMVLAALVKAVACLGEGSKESFLTNGNAMNGVISTGDTLAIEEFLGKEVGSRVVLMGDAGLNKAVLEAREKGK